MKKLNQSRLPLIVFMAVMSHFALAQSVKKLDPQNFDKKLKESKETILIDVRTPAEYAQGHLANAVSIDIYANDFKSRIGKLDKTKPVFVYCKAGSRSGSAVNIMEEMGFKEIYDLSGGIIGWQQANKPTVK